MYKLIVFCIISQANSLRIISMVNQNLAEIIRNSNASIVKDPERSAECFSIYTIKLTNLTNEFEANYTRCIGISNNATSCLHRQVKPDLDRVDLLRDEICSRFYMCRRNDSQPYTYFECMNNAAGEAIPTTHLLQNLSKDKMQYLSFKYEVIRYNEYTCTETYSQLYLQEAESLRDELEKCLNAANRTNNNSQLTMGIQKIL
uniref:Protein TsetseEP domain-containing protein n=1 Tax=Musca domestica TaxID=7370 RepID=A0A1I8NCW3_MUSDO